MEAEQQIADAEEMKAEEEAEAERSVVENFEVAEVVEFRRRLKVSDEAEVHVGTAVSF
jgi:DNA-binding transcriptional regulator YiaG